MTEAEKRNLLGDLVEVPPVRTVIRMADLDNKERRRELVESFVLTGEAEGNLTNVLTSIVKGRGQGYFLHGNFGSGKSHLLGILNLLLTSPQSRASFLAGSRRYNPDPALLRALAALEERRYLVVTLSLVEHSNREYLEEILLGELSGIMTQVAGRSLGWAASGKALEELGKLLRDGYPREVAEFCNGHQLAPEELFRPGRQSQVEELLQILGRPYRISYDRREAFARVQEFLAAEGYAGLVILVDELSEFLRSKPDSRTFNEDIRFLQFLGELAPELPAWVVATLQERLEETGEVPPEAFNKIKDRYPVRLRLSGQHVAQLISGRLIVKKPGADERIGEIHSRLSRAFGDLPFTRQEFFDLYPVHPLTVSLLDSLRPLFSQHRGVVDFIHYQLKGDPERDIPCRLDRPAAAMLGPDVIYDHFQGRLRELPETNPYIEQVYRYWEGEGLSLLGEEDRETARRLLKILILSALSPQPRVTVRRLAEYLLDPITTFDSQVNYDYIRDLLERMCKHGAYLAWEKGEEPLADRVYIDLEADLNRLCRRRLDYIKKSLFPGDRRVLTKLAPWVQEGYLPLASWQEAPRSKRTVTWQKTRREGLFLFGSLTELSAEYIRELVEKLEATELDFVLAAGTPLEREAQLEHLTRVVFPLLEQSRGFLFWVPAAPAAGDTLTEALALQLLAEECQERDDSNSRRLARHVEGVIADLRPRVRELYRDAYFQGQILLDTEETLEPAALGIMPFDRFLEWAAGNLLNRRYPRHARVAPRASLVPPGALQKTLEDFLLPGQVKGGNLDPGLKMILEGFLSPLGLVRKGGKGYKLHLNPKESPVLAEFLHCLEGGEIPLERVYRHLRKGPYGLGPNSFQILGLTLLASGIVQGRRGDRTVGVRQLRADGFWHLDTVNRGGMLAPDFQEYLQRLSFLPPRLRQGPMTPALQQEVWEAVIQWRREQDQALEEVRRQLQRVRDYPALACLNFDGIEEELSRLAAISAEVKVSYSPQEGLERFLAAHRAQPYFDRYYKTLGRLEEFLAGEMEHYLFIHSYLTNPDLLFPPGEKYRPLEEEREALLALGRDEASIFNREDYRRLTEGFAAFVENYREVYFAEHEAACAPERFRAYRQFYENRGYKVLSLLAGIEAISVKDDLVKVRRQVEAILAQSCRQAEPHLLAKQPLCRCGFRLGQQPELVPLARLEGTVEEGIRQYVAALQKGKNAQQIRAWLAGMAEVGKRHQVAPVRDLLALDPGDGDLLASLERLLNRRVIDLVNQALAGRRVMVERCIEDLVDSLVDRSFAVDQIETIVREWLQAGEELPPDVFVKVVARGGKGNPGIVYTPGGGGTDVAIAESRLSRELKEWLGRECPELDSGAEAVLLLALAGWLASHRQDPARALGLVGAQGRNYIDQEKLGELGLQMVRGDFPWREEVLGLSWELVQERGLTDKVWDLVSPRGGEEEQVEALVNFLGQEEFFPGLAKRALERLLQFLAPGRVELCRRLLKQAGGHGDRETCPLGAPALKLARNLAALEDSLARLQGRKTMPRQWRQWEQVYTRDLALLEWWLTRVQELALALRVDHLVALESLATRVQRVGVAYGAEFGAFYRDYGTGENPPWLTLPRLWRELDWQVKGLRPSGLYLILLDGLRLDTWRVLEEEIMGGLPCRCREEGLLWAALPTVTGTQLEALREWGWQGEIIEGEEAARSGADPEVLGRELEGLHLAPEERLLLRFSFVDNKVHTSLDPYGTFLAEVVLQARRTLLPFLQNVPPGSAVVILSDHGYGRNYAFRKAAKFAEPRYLHGGISLYEVMVPWALLLWE